MRKPLRVGMSWRVRAIVAIAPQPAEAGTAAETDKEVDVALEKLYANSFAAKDFSTIAQGILVYSCCL